MSERMLLYDCGFIQGYFAAEEARIEWLDRVVTNLLRSKAPQAAAKLEGVLDAIVIHDNDLWS